LIQVEQLFRTAKALMRTRPIYHSSDAAIRGHVFCSFLALVLRKELDERCRTAGLRPEWGDVLRDLDRLQEVAISKDGRQMMSTGTGLSAIMGFENSVAGEFGDAVISRVRDRRWPFRVAVHGVWAPRAA
jgi:hypothetical protein